MVLTQGSTSFDTAKISKLVDPWQDGGMTTVTPPRPTPAACCAPGPDHGPGPGPGTEHLDSVPSTPPDGSEPATAPEALARTFKALGDPARVRLLAVVAASAGGEACVCDLVEPVGLSQPTVSHHLKILVDAGLLHREKRGVWAYYALVPGALDAVARNLTAFAG